MKEFSRIFQYPKPELRYSEIQDRYAYDKKNFIVVISDGVTNSWHSESWAKFLVERFKKNPQFNKNYFKTFCKETIKDYSLPELEKNKIKNKAYKKIFEKRRQAGSAATFLAIKVDFDQKSCKYLNVGDSFLFHINSKDKIKAAINGDNDFITTDKNKDIKVETGNIEFDDGEKIILATDGIGKYISLNKNSRDEIRKILDFDNFDNFKDFIWNSWNGSSDCKIDEDDITMAIINLSKSKKIKEYYPPNKGFSYEIEKKTNILPKANIKKNENKIIKDIRLKDIETKTKESSKISNLLSFKKQDSKISIVHFELKIEN
tara:strand:- start:5344 stop:6297 length:954 start_codon:yes stop_codon:yes gene_type:complete